MKRNFRNENSHMRKLLLTWFLCFLLSIILLGLSALLLDSKGSVVLTLIGSAVLVVILSGIRLRSQSMREFSSLVGFKKSMVSQLSFFVVVHSHHVKKLRDRGKEFRIGGKYFCTGCYGIAVGIFIGGFLTIVYLFIGLNQTLLSILTFTLPLWFVPIVLRYTIFRRAPTLPRFLSNMLMPIGCYSALIIADNSFGNWIVNGILLLFFAIAGYLRAWLSEKENHKLLLIDQGISARESAKDYTRLSI